KTHGREALRRDLAEIPSRAEGRERLHRPLDAAPAGEALGDPRLRRLVRRRLTGRPRVVQRVLAFALVLLRRALRVFLRLRDVGERSHPAEVVALAEGGDDDVAFGPDVADLLDVLLLEGREHHGLLLAEAFL